MALRRSASAAIVALVVGVGLALAPAVASPPGNAAASSTILRVAAGTVVIKRDTYGTPNIYAGSVYGLFYGYGYAAAQDRLFQLDMARRASEGTVAAVLGPRYVGYDTALRGQYDPASIRRQIAALSARQRDVLQGYAAGVNARIVTVLGDRSHLLPREYLDFGFKPTAWSTFDVAMIVVATMDIRFSGYSAELSNLNDLNALQAKFGARRGRQIFNQLKWRVDPKAPSTITPADLGGTSQAGANPTDSSNGLVAASAPTVAAAVPSASVRTGAVDALLAAVAPGQAPPRFSNMMLVGKRRASGAASLLLNGPQFGWYNPSYVYSVGLHGAGFDIVGNTPFAYPVVLFGHNRDISWGATAGNGDTVDTYQEHLKPGNPQEYLFRGRYRQMAARTDTLAVKGSAPQHVTVYSTVHGLVVASDPAQGVAYSQRRTWAGREVSVLFTWMKSTQASTYPQWLDAARQLPISINWYYADRRGNIGYAFCGRFPIRPATQNTRLPASGTGNMEWLGFQPFWRANPHILDPRQGWLANWNNSPAPGYPDADFVPWGRADRVTILQHQLAAHPTITAAQLWAIMRYAAFADLNAPYFLPFIARAVQGLPSGSPALEVYRVLASWDRMNTLGRDGRYASPGTATMETWLSLMLATTLGKTLPAAVFAEYSGTNYPTRESPIITSSEHISAGAQVLYNGLLGKRATVPQPLDIFGGQSKDAVIREVLRSTDAELRKEFGGGPRTWRPLVAQGVFSPLLYTGIPAADPSEELVEPIFMNRGTENDLMVATASKITGYEVAPPGESGFVAPNGARSRHYADQFDLYADFGKKRTWFTPAEVQAHLESVQVLHF